MRRQSPQCIARGPVVNFQILDLQPASAVDPLHQHLAPLQDQFGQIFHGQTRQLGFGVRLCLLGFSGQRHADPRPHQPRPTRPQRYLQPLRVYPHARIVTGRGDPLQRKPAQQ